MDLQIVNYRIIAGFGDLALFQKKLQMENQTVDEIKDTLDENGSSLTEEALANRRFEIAHYLLDHGAKVNVVTKDRRNELHVLATNINFSGGVQLAHRLLDLGVDLDLQDKKYGNTALFTLCMEVFTKRSDEGIAFIVRCLKTRPNIHLQNRIGYSVERLIRERGAEPMKKALEELSDE